MKKKVRIYRAPDGQGAFLNKTAKFLKKAQEGGMPDPSMMGYPGAEQQQAQPSEDQVAQSIVVDISNGRPKEETVMRLVTSLGQDPLSASQYYDQIYTALEAQQNEAEEEADEDSEDTPIKEEIEQNQVQEIEEGFYGDDTNNDMANEIAAEDDEDYADDDQVASDIIMQFGGVSPVIVPIRQDGGEAYPIQFPGVEAYLPPNMQEILNGQTDVLTGQAWSPVDESQAGVASDEESADSYKKGGQYKKDKRVYVNSMMKLVKKQMGGEDMSKQGDTDPRGEDVRKQRLDAFLGTVKNQSQMAKAKEQAEQQFDQMMQQQQQMQQQYPMQQQFAQNGAQINSSVQGMDRDPGFVINPKTGKPWSKSEWDNQGVISGCFGGNCLPDESEAGILPGQSDIIGLPKGKAKSGTPPYISGYPVPNIYGNQIPMRRGLFGRPKMPRGVGFGYGMPVSKIDVRRTGIFGRPKEYSIEFGASPMPGMPGSGAGFYGYGQTTKKTGKTKGRIITEEVSKTINSASTDEVAKNTPGNTATNTPTLEEMRKAAAAAGYDPWSTTSTDVVDNSTASNIKKNSATSNKRKGVEVNNEATDAVINNSNAQREENAITEQIKSNLNKKEIKGSFGDGLYTYPGKSGIYKKKNGVWYIDSSGSGKNFKAITTDKEARVKRLEAQAQPYNDVPKTFDNKDKQFLQVKDIDFNQLQKNYKPQIQIGSKEFYALSPDKRKKLRDAYYRDKPDNWVSAVYHKGPKIASDLVNDAFIKPFKQEGGAQYYNPFGGFVDSDNPDLYKFVYGGNDPYFTQEDLDDVYSKDTSDPYFAMGGLTTYQNKGEVKEDDYDKYQREKAEKEALDEYNSFMNRGEGDAKKMVAYKANTNDAIYNKILGQTRKKYNIADPNEQPKSNNTTTTTQKKTTTTQSDDDGYYSSNPSIGYNGYNVFGNLFPANIASYQGTWGKVKRGPYDPRTGMAIPGMGFGPNTQISSIDVKRSGMFGRPKKYTINYSNQQMDPRKQNLITVPGQGTSGSTTTPGSQGYSGQDPATQKQGDRFSNTKGLKAGTRAKIAMKELFNRYNDEEEVPETNVDVDQSPEQKTPELIKMDIKRPGKIAPTKDLQARLDQDAKAKEAKESFGDYGDISSELGDKNVQNEYQKIYETQGKEAAEDFMQEKFANRNKGVIANEEAAQAKAALETQKSEQDYRNSMDKQYMEDLGIGEYYKEPSEEPLEDSSSQQPDQQTESPEDLQYGEDQESDEFFDKGYFGNQSINRYDKYRNPVSNQVPVNKSNSKKGTENAKKVNNKVLASKNKVDSSEETIMDRINNSTTNFAKQEKKEYWPSDIANNQGEIRRGTNVKDVGYEIAQRSKAQKNTNETKQMTSLIDKSAKERDSKIAEINKRNISSDEKRKLIEAENQRHLDNYANIEKNYEQKKKFRKRSYMTNDPLTLKQFGGDLQRFVGGVSRFQPGGYVNQTPVVFTDNPAHVGMSNVDMISLNEGIPDLKPSSFWSDQASFNEEVPVNTAKQPEQIKMDPTQVSSDQAKKEYQATPGDFSIDVKNKNMYEIDPEAAINVANAGIRGTAGLIERWGNKKREAKMYDNLTADNLYASDPSRDRGDYDVNTGLYRPNEQGAMHTSRSKRYGGNIYQDGGQRRSFYNTAIGDYNQWLANPKAWQDDPEMLAPDGKSLNLCLDCMDMDYTNEQDIRDAHKLIEEGYSTGTHRNEEAFNTGLKQYGLEHPIYSSKKQLAKNQFGGYYDEEDDDVAYMTEDQIKQFLANGGEIEYL